MAEETYLYVVLLVVRTHHAVVYEMPTAAAPEKAIAINKKFRVAGGLDICQCHPEPLSEPIYTYKLRCKFSVPQSSAMMEKTARTGILSKLL